MLRKLKSQVKYGNTRFSYVFNSFKFYKPMNRIKAQHAIKASKSIFFFSFKFNFLIILASEAKISRFSVLITAHEILNISESIILKFNYSALIHSYSLGH